MKFSITSYFKNIRAGFKQFSMAIVSGYLFSIAAIISIHMNLHWVHQEQEMFFQRGVFALLIGIFLALNLDMGCGISGRWPKSWPWVKIPLFFVSVVLFFFVLGPIDFFYPYRVFMFSVLLIFLFILQYAQKEGMAFLEDLKYIFVRLGVCGFYAGVLYGGISLILVAVSVLFDIRVPPELWGDGFVLVSGVFFITSYFSNLAAKPETKKEFLIFDGLIAYALLPILSGLILVFYAYGIKILITWALPKNIITAMTLGAGFALYAIMLFLYTAKPFRFKKAVEAILPKAFFPFLFLAGYSVFLRVHAYGLTEARVAAIYGLLFLFATWLIILIRGWVAARWTVFVFAFLCLLAQIGPISLFNLSYQSQQKRIIAYAKADGILQDGKIKLVADTPHNKEIAQVFDYLRRRHPQKVSAIFEHNPDIGTIQEVFPAHGAPRAIGEKPRRDYFYFAMPKLEPVLVPQDTWLLYLNENQQAVSFGEESRAVLKKEEGKILIYQSEREIQEIDLTLLIQQIREDQKQNQSALHSFQVTKDITCFILEASGYTEDTKTWIQNIFCMLHIQQK